jgi:SAM-dependent methyltransferase
MLAEMARAVPGVPATAAAAEMLPLRDGTVDAVLVAQAWHWVDPDRAVPEIARVLRPGGRLGLMWNMRDEREPWVARLGTIIHASDEQRTDSASPRVGAPFGPVERLDVSWTCHLTLSGLLDLVASRSYIITLPPDERAAVLGAVTELVDRHPALDRSDIPLPYVTRCSRTHLPG